MAAMALAYSQVNVSFSGVRFRRSKLSAAGFKERARPVSSPSNAPHRGMADERRLGRTRKPLNHSRPLNPLPHNDALIPPST